jgi:hypothetical protein
MPADFADALPTQTGDILLFLHLMRITLWAFQVRLFSDCVRDYQVFGFHMMIFVGYVASVYDEYHVVDEFMHYGFDGGFSVELNTGGLYGVFTYRIP